MLQGAKRTVINPQEMTGQDLAFELPPTRAISLPHVGRQSKYSSRWVFTRLFLAVGLALFVRSRHRVRVFGEVPNRGQSTLVLANHQHDLDGLVIPSLLNLQRPWGRPVYCVASQRLFEPGFFAVRMSTHFLSMLRRWNFAKLFAGVGVLPMENQPLSRPDASLAYEIMQEYGNVRLEDVFTSAALTRYRLRKGARLRALWTRANAPLALTDGALRNLKPAFRQFIRDRERFVIEHQANQLASTLEQGETLFLLPEGRYSRDGRMAPMRASLEWLLPLAEKVYLFAISYDVFRSQRADFVARVVSFEPRAYSGAGGQPLQALATSLKAARPVTFSQLFSQFVSSLRAAHDASRDVSFSVGEVSAAMSRQMAELPATVFVDPELVHDLSGVVHSALANLRRRGLVRAERGRYRFTDIGKTRDFPGVQDIIRYQSNMLQETVRAGVTALTGRALP